MFHCLNILSNEHLQYRLGIDTHHSCECAIYAIIAMPLHPYQRQSI